MPVKLLSLEEAGAFLNIETKEIRAMVTSGELPCIYQGTRMMFEHDELDNWYTNRLVNHIPLTHTIQNRYESSQERSLVEYCSVETMDPAIEGKTKPAILRSLTRLAERSGLLYDPEEFLENLRKREEVGSTAMEEGIALVHPQTRDEYTCEAPFIAVGRAQRGVFFGEANGVPTDLFFLVCSADSQEHLQMLAGLCQVIAEGKLLPALRAAETPEDMFAAFQELA